MRWLGLLRSLVVYWRPSRQAGLRRLYAPWVSEGDLVFDVGAHVGDRAAAFASLGARVVAVEPQPHVADWLRRLTRRSGAVTVRTEAVGAEAGTATLAISRRTPTMSSLSGSWRDRIREANPGARGVRWEDSIAVPVVTLDALIDEYGVPTFCKIDVEGFEPEVLAGLSRPVPGLSFEFVSGDLEGAIACVRRLGELGRYAFNVILGEGRQYHLRDWVDSVTMTDWLERGADGASSGDIYARRASAEPRS